jgi:hypothetical protein
MGACAETPNCVERAEHACENIKVNDAFFPFLALIKSTPPPYFALIGQTHHRAIEPKANFLEEHAKMPPRLLLEIRKGAGFQLNQPLIAVVTLQPSGRIYQSQPASGRLPRWYALMCQDYHSKPFDTSASLEIIDSEGQLLGQAIIDLEKRHNRYVVKWIRLKGLIKPTPSAEIRLWYLTDPAGFWSPDSEELKTAVSEALSAN